MGVRRAVHAGSRRLGCALGALTGGLAAGPVLSASVAGLTRFPPPDRLYVVTVGAALIGAATVALGALSRSTLGGVLVGAVLPWLFVPAAGSRLAFVGSTRRDGLLVVLVPLVCAGLPGALAVVAGARRGEAWPDAFLGALATPALLLAAYRLAGPGNTDHLDQAEPYAFVHLAVPVAVIGTALPASIAGSVQRGSPATWWQTWRALRVREQDACTLLASLLLLLAVLSIGEFQPGRVSFRTELVLGITAAVAGLAAAIVVTTAVVWQVAPSVNSARAARGRAPG